jgi:hypothetical protein
MIMNALQVARPSETSMGVSERVQSSPGNCLSQVQFQNCYRFELQSQNQMVQEGMGHVGRGGGPGGDHRRKQTLKIFQSQQQTEHDL